MLDGVSSRCFFDAELWHMVHYSVGATECTGQALAVCPALRLVAVVTDVGRKIEVFEIPKGPFYEDPPPKVLFNRVAIMRIPCSDAENTFRLREQQGVPACIAFTDSSCPTPNLLLVADCAAHTVRMIDVVRKEQMGTVGERSAVRFPRSVATKGSFVAVGRWESATEGSHEIDLFEHSDSAWRLVRSVGSGFGMPGPAHGQLHCPLSMIFTPDCSFLWVVDAYNNRISKVCRETGELAQIRTTGTKIPIFIESDDVGYALVLFMGTTGIRVFEGHEFSGEKRRFPLEDGPGNYFFVQLARMPEFGILALNTRNDKLTTLAIPMKLHILGTPDIRVAWMGAVRRGYLHRTLLGKPSAGLGRTDKRPK